MRKVRIEKILLLNPPFDGLYIRDQFCSHLSKGTYYWQPLDLLCLSGCLHADGYEMAVLDAVAEGLSIEKAHARIDEFSPDAVIFLTGCDSFDEDIAFVEETKRRGAKVAIGIGDILREQGEELLRKHPALDACLLDFVTHGVHSYLQGNLDKAENMMVRTGTKVRRIPARDKQKLFSVPPPRYDLFPLKQYRLPHNRYHPYATVLASSNCPYGCSFCPFARTAYRAREADDVLRNLEVIRNMGIRQVHFADWTFAVHRKQTMTLLEGMIDAGFDFTWDCLSRVDLMDHELMSLMRRAGCELIEFGVESGSQALLDRYEKDITIEQIRRAFQSAKELDISTLATFVLGLPDETRESLQKTLALALEIEPTFCSFNMASPQPATQLRRELIDGGGLNPDAPAILDSSRSVPVFSTSYLSAKEVYEFRNHAVRQFYLRPSYVVNRLRNIRSMEELQNHIFNGFSLAWQTVVKPLKYGN